MDSKKTKKVSRKSTQLKDELSSSQSASTSTVRLAVLAAPIYAAKWRENMEHQPNERIANQTLMMCAVDEAKAILELCK